MNYDLRILHDFGVCSDFCCIVTQASMFDKKRHWVSAPLHSLLERAIAKDFRSATLVGFYTDLCQARFDYLYNHQVGAVTLPKTPLS